MYNTSVMIATSWQESPVSQQFRALGQELGVRGHQVTLLIDRHNRSKENHEANPAVFTWPSFRPTGFKDAKFLSHILRRRRPDCLISNFGSVNLMTLLGWLHGVPHRIVWHHTLSSQTDADTPLPGWKLSLLRWRKRRVWRLATAIAAVSHAAKQDLRVRFGVPESKCRVVHNSLEDPLGGEFVPRRLSGENRLLCVARFHRSKGQDVLLKAAALLKRHVSRIRIDFLGDGPLRSDCQELASGLGLGENCTFLGAVTHEQVLEEMSRSDVIVVPSRSEAFGLVALESIAFGIPVVASDVGGLPEILGEGLKTLLVRPDDSQAMADCLRQLLENSGEYSEMSLRARTQFLREFEQSMAVRKQADWIEGLMAQAVPQSGNNSRSLNSG